MNDQLKRDWLLQFWDHQDEQLGSLVLRNHTKIEAEKKEIKVANILDAHTSKTIAIPIRRRMRL